MPHYKTKEVSNTVPGLGHPIGAFYIPYSAKFWRGKTLANRSFQTFGEENVGELTIANNIISYFNESGIWLGKILANDVQFAKSAKVFPRQNFALYGSRHQLYFHRVNKILECIYKLVQYNGFQLNGQFLQIQSYVFQNILCMEQTFLIDTCSAAVSIT